MKLTVLFLVFLSFFVFAEETFNEKCRTELGVLNDCNNAHKKDSDRWFCYRAPKENNNECYNKDSTFYKCDFGSQMRICEGYISDSAENMPYVPHPRSVPANQQPSTSR